MLDNLKEWWQGLSDKNKQNSKSILVVLVVSIVGYIFLGGINNKNVNDSKLIEDSEIDLSAAKGDYSIEESWVEKSELKLEEIQDQLEEQLAENEKIIEEMDQLNLRLDLLLEDGSNSDIKREIDKIKNQIGINKPTNSNVVGDSNNDPFLQAGGYETRSSNSNNTKYYESNDEEYDITSSQIELVYHNASESDKNSCKPPICLPAYSYAAGILISTADVVTGVNSQANPKPILIKLITEAVSVKDPVSGKYVKTDLRECKVGGRITAELSSERGNVVLDKMVCADKNGGTIETEIEGYVADLSKHGISGKVVRREGDLVSKSFLAGMIGGIGSGLSAKLQQGISFQDGFTSTDDMSSEDILLQGIGSGIEQSSMTVEQYLIKRAEQYQPTIETSPGKLIEVVFISKAYLDGRDNSNQQSDVQN